MVKDIGPASLISSVVRLLRSHLLLARRLIAQIVLKPFLFVQLVNGVTDLEGRFGELMRDASWRQPHATHTRRPKNTGKQPLVGRMAVAKTIDGDSCARSTLI